MEENKIEENIEELDVSRDQAAIVSMLRLQALEEILVEKKIIEREELVERFASLNSNFVNSLLKLTKKLEKANK